MPRHSRSTEIKVNKKNYESMRLSRADVEAMTAGDAVGDYGNELMKLHWNSGKERKGVGKLVRMANHMAIICKDIGHSSYFYGDVLGLQEIERPNFDRYGTWFTCGNMELHLIKGEPCVPFGEDLIVPHLALDAEDIPAVMAKLDSMDPPIKYQVNVSVPTGDLSKIVQQIFIRDPDGYYIEIGQTSVLTGFCMGNRLYDAFSDVQRQTKSTDILKYIGRMKSHAQNARARVKDHSLRKFKTAAPDYPAYDPQKVVVDQEMLKRMMKRTKIFGATFNGYNPVYIIQLLKKYDNCAPDVMLDLIIKAEKEGQVLCPPAYYDQGKMDQINPGQHFTLKRGHAGKEPPIQKRYYTPGQEAMRYESINDVMSRQLCRLEMSRPYIQQNKNSLKLLDEAYKGMKEAMDKIEILRQDAETTGNNKSKFDYEDQVKAAGEQDETNTCVI